MGLTRSFLKGMNLTDEQVGAIIEAHADTVDALKSQRDQYKADAEKLESVQKELDKLKEAAENGGDYDKLKKEYEDFKAEVQKKETIEAKKKALTELAKDAGLSEAGIAKAIKYADWDSIELEDDGKVKDSKAQIKSLKEEWAEYVQTSSTTGANTATPPAGASGKTYKTKDEIFAIKDDAERQKAIADNHELFGF